jgi:hypothetical protein
MFIPDPDFCPSRIPELRSQIQKQQQKRGVNKKLPSYLFVATTQISQIVNCFIFEPVERKNLGQFPKDYRTFYPNNCHYLPKLSKIGIVWDPRSGIRKKPISDPVSGVKKAPNPGSGSATLVKINCLNVVQWTA